MLRGFLTRFACVYLCNQLAADLKDEGATLQYMTGNVERKS